MNDTAIDSRRRRRVVVPAGTSLHPLRGSSSAATDCITDPVAFASDVLGLTLQDFQKRLIKGSFKGGRIVIVSTPRRRPNMNALIESLSAAEQEREAKRRESRRQIKLRYRITDKRKGRR